MKLLFQIFQINLLWLPIRVFHIIDMKLCKITCYNPPWTSRIRKFRSISFSLLKRSKKTTVALLDRFLQIFS